MGGDALVQWSGIENDAIPSAAAPGARASLRSFTLLLLYISWSLMSLPRAAECNSLWTDRRRRRRQRPCAAEDDHHLYIVEEKVIIYVYTYVRLYVCMYILYSVG